VGEGVESVGMVRDRPNFWLPHINLGTGKATNFKFCTHIAQSKQKPMKNLCKSIRGCSQHSAGSPENFHSTHIWGALRGHLCDITAFSYTLLPELYEMKFTKLLRQISFALL